MSIRLSRCALPRLVSRLAGQPGFRNFCAAADETMARARAMKDTPYNRAQEGDISAPNYVGWDAEIQADFEKLQTGPKQGGRPYKEVCDSALDLIGFTPMVRMSRLQKPLGLE